MFVLTNFIQTFPVKKTKANLRQVTPIWHQSLI